MPLYEYKCAVCKVTQESLRGIDSRNDGPKCDFCPAIMPLVMSVPRPAVIPGGTNAGYGTR
jgi:putative FmdB family regulatory protein